MRKRNLILLSVICILSACVFTGLLVYASDRRQMEDKRNRTEVNEDNTAPTAAPAGDAFSGEGEVLISPTPSIAPTPTKIPANPIVLGFAGDVNLDEDSYPVAKYDAEGKGILGVLSEDLVKEMKHADIMMLNNEFAYSTRGTEETDKSYTFRANPKRVGILGEMGVDIVSLANNHTLDFGREALSDTFRTLDSAGIDYVGAGDNLERAKAPVYRTVGNKTIAFVAASRVVFAMDWYAADTASGMVGTYDPAIILEAIKEAEANSDFVVVFVHWGVERNNYPEDYQRTLAKDYIDAGADLVVGCHPHVMQGFEYYKGKLIAYSLGNFWFNNSTKESGMLKLYLDPNGGTRMQILPVRNKNTKTYILTRKKDRSSYFDFMEGLSYNAVIDDDGFITDLP